MSIRESARALALGVGLLGLAACSQTPAPIANVVNNPQTATDGCNAAAGTLSALADLRTAGKLSASQIAAINNVKPAMDSFCQGENAPIGTMAYAQFLANLGMAATIQLQAGE